MAVPGGARKEGVSKTRKLTARQVRGEHVGSSEPRTQAFFDEWTNRGATWPTTKDKPRGPDEQTAASPLRDTGARPLSIGIPELHRQKKEGQSIQIRRGGIGAAKRKR